jgi:hypothetical protein
MAVMESLMAAKAAYDVGSGVMNWLNAKNKKFELTPQERKARDMARRQAMFGMGSESMQTAANQIRGQAADAAQQVRANAFSGGLENSAISQRQQAKVQQGSEQQLAQLALRIADRNAQFRERASTRAEQINMQLGQRERQFEEARKAQMRQAAFQTGTALFDLAIKSSAAKAANDETILLAKESAQVTESVNKIQNAVASNDLQTVNQALTELGNAEISSIDVVKLLSALFTQIKTILPEPKKEGG